MKHVHKWQTESTKKNLLAFCSFLGIGRGGGVKDAGEMDVYKVFY